MPFRQYFQILTLLVIAVSSATAAKTDSIEYLIKITEPQHHLANIEMTIPKGQTRVKVQLPNWRTGNYLIINQANGIRNFKAFDNRRNPLDWTRTDKSSWQIENPNGGKVTLSYLLYANELGKRTRHIDSSHAFLDATATLMYDISQMEIPHKVKLKVPKKWRSFSGMNEVGKHQFVAKNYHQLADSPIEVGINNLVEFDHDGRDYQVVFWGKANRDYKEIAADLETMVSKGQKIWHGYPFEKYVFMIHATSGASGATEHINSTVIQRSRELFGKREDYLDRFLRVAAHEFIHTWNVKAYRPKGLVPYNYQSENYSDLLWIAEGSTSYFEDSMLLVSELQTVEEYLKSLSKRIHKFNHRPGANFQSVKDASFEKWISQGGDFANNYSANIYSEGFMASLLLDFKMLEDSKLEVSYKDLHQQIYSNFKVNPNGAIAYDTESIFASLKMVTGNDYRVWWKENIESPLNIDFDKLLHLAGIKFKPIEDKDLKIWMGFESDSKKNLISLEKVERNGPAWQAGLTVDDELLAIDNYKVTRKNLEKWLEQYKVGDDILVTLFRDDKLMTKKLTLGQYTKDPLKLELVASPTESQKAFFKAWLGVDFPERDNKEL